MPSHRSHATSLVALAFLSVNACASPVDDLAATSSDADADTDADTDTDTDTDADADPPPETESDFLAMAPAQTDTSVFIANPDRDTVTRVDVFTRQVDTVDVGRNPSNVLTTPDHATVVVFNKDDDTVTLLDADTLAQDVVAIRPNKNRMVLSPDGRWCLLWRDEAAAQPGDLTDGLVSFNELDVVDVESAEVWELSVGAYPHGVEFTPDGSHALVISDANLALVDLTATPLDRELIPIADDLLDPPVAEEVVLAPDGAYAFVRQFGAQEIAIVDLATRTVDRVAAGDNPTDLDLTPDGQRAVVVARDSNELWLFDVADPFAPPEVLDLPDTLVNGSVILDPTGRVGLLYSTAVLQDVYATWDLATGEVTARALVKPIDTISITATGGAALIFHTLDNGPSLEPDDLLWDAPALTMIDLGDFTAAPVWMPAPVAGYAHSDDGRHAYFIMEDEAMIGVLDHEHASVETVYLPSDAVYIGVMSDADPTDDDEPPVWASQEHDLGRISFFDVDDASLETITGFELNSQIE
jgi:DNA-binding beta-propeller fold protein YncE